MNKKKSNNEQQGKTLIKKPKTIMGPIIVLDNDIKTIEDAGNARTKCNDE